MRIVEDALKQPLVEQTSVALGFFDGVHKAHQTVIGFAVEAAEEKGLVPAVFTFKTTTSQPKSKSGYKYILTERLKYEMLKRCGTELAAVMDFEEVEEYSAEDFILEILAKKLNAKAVSFGYDFRFGKNAAGDADLLKALCERAGIYFYLVGAVSDGRRPISSTRIREYLQDGKIAEANRLLGYSYCFDGEVIKGEKIGSKIGFPTINQRFEPQCVVPKHGVYISEIALGNEVYLGVTNIGVKPTVNDENQNDGESHKTCAETHILGFKGDLYGKNIVVSLKAFLRPEQKFENLDKLKEQIQKDIDIAKSLK